jgi:hypothetical protein
MQEILNERGEEKFNELLNSHILPFDKDDFFFTDDYKEFLTWRQGKLWHQIQSATGKSGLNPVENLVLDLEPIDEDDDNDEENEIVEASRSYWEGYAEPQSMKMADSIIELIKMISEPTVHYNKSHISIETVGRNFIWCYPRLFVRIRVDNGRDELVKNLSDKGIDCRRGKRHNFIRIDFIKKDFEENKETIFEAIKIAESQSH